MASAGVAHEAIKHRDLVAARLTAAARVGRRRRKGSQIRAIVVSAVRAGARRRVGADRGGGLSHTAERCARCECGGMEAHASGGYAVEQVHGAANTSIRSSGQSHAHEIRGPSRRQTPSPQRSSVAYISGFGSPVESPAHRGAVPGFPPMLSRRERGGVAVQWTHLHNGKSDCAGARTSSLCSVGVPAASRRHLRGQRGRRGDAGRTTVASLGHRTTALHCRAAGARVQSRSWMSS